MKTLLSAIALCCAFAALAESKTSAFRLELKQDDAGDEAAYIIGADGESRRVVVVDPEEYKMLSERFDRVWNAYHATSDGRRKLHGKVERTEIDEAAHLKTTVYADGYTHVERMLPRKRPGVPKKMELALKIGREKREAVKTKGMSQRQWDMRQAFERYRLGTPKTVTVDHDASTGKDTVKEGE